MTPEERAEKVFDALEAAEGEQLCGARVRPERVSLIAAAIREAVCVEVDRLRAAEVCYRSALCAIYVVADQPDSEIAPRLDAFCRGIMDIIDEALLQ